MSYCSPAQLISRYDSRALGQLCEDNGNVVSPTNLLTDPNIQAALDDGTGEINTAIQQGNRYTAQDITNLINLGTPGLNVLIRLNADLAYKYLAMRRGYGSKELDTMPQWQESEKKLEQLRLGERILALPDAIEAGVNSFTFPGPMTYYNLQLARDHNQRFFPLRPIQRPRSF